MRHETVLCSRISSAAVHVAKSGLLLISSFLLCIRGREVYCPIVLFQDISLRKEKSLQSLWQPEFGLEGFFYGTN